MNVIQADRYPAQVFWNEEDEGFIALAPDLPGCSAFGGSREEAVQQLLTAIQAWVEAAEAAGNPVPAPTQSATRPQYSGKVLVRMPRDLHGRLARSAEQEGVSLNQYIVYLLSRSYAEHTLSSIYGSSIRQVVSPVQVSLHQGQLTTFNRIDVRAVSVSETTSGTGSPWAFHRTISSSELHNG